LPSTGALDRQAEVLSYRCHFDQSLKHCDARDRSPGNVHYYISRSHPGLCRRHSGRHTPNHDRARGNYPIGHPTVARVDLHTNDCAAKSTKLRQVRTDAPGSVCGNRKAHARDQWATAEELGVDPYNLAAQVDQRSAGVERVHSRVGLK
jgi:hypothetical protein